VSEFYSNAQVFGIDKKTSTWVETGQQFGVGAGCDAISLGGVFVRVPVEAMTEE
jgi:hypothetical protein